MEPSCKLGPCQQCCKYAAPSRVARRLSYFLRGVGVCVCGGGWCVRGVSVGGVCAACVDGCAVCATLPNVQCTHKNAQKQPDPCTGDVLEYFPQASCVDHGKVATPKATHEQPLCSCLLCMHAYRCGTYPVIPPSMVVGTSTCNGCSLLIKHPIDALKLILQREQEIVAAICIKRICVLDLLFQLLVVEKPSMVFGWCLGHEGMVGCAGVCGCEVGGPGVSTYQVLYTLEKQSEFHAESTYTRQGLQRALLDALPIKCRRICSSVSEVSGFYIGELGVQKMIIAD